MYIMATSELTTTANIPTASIAYEKINLAGADKPFRGITFRLEEEQQVYLGFQADLSTSVTNNFRVSEVKLLQYSEMTYDRLQALIAEVTEGVASLKVDNNTGHYSVEAYALVTEAIAEAKKLDKKASIEGVTAAYETLAQAYADLQNSSAQQEFRVQSVKLVTYTAIEDDIEAVKQQATDTHIIYILQGVRVASPINALPQGLYIVDGKKLLIP
jgi:hypothetical protein